MFKATREGNPRGCYLNLKGLAIRFATADQRVTTWKPLGEQGFHGLQGPLAFLFAGEMWGDLPLPVWSVGDELPPGRGGLVRSVGDELQPSRGRGRDTERQSRSERQRGYRETLHVRRVTKQLTEHHDRRADANPAVQVKNIGVIHADASV